MDVNVQNYHDAFEHRIYRFSLFSAVFTSLLISIIYAFAQMYLDALFGLIAFVLYLGVYQLYRQGRIGYDLATRIFVLSAGVLILGGFMVSSSVLDGYIFIILVPIIAIVLRPKIEAVVIITAYYALFLAINLLELGVVAIEPRLLVLSLFVENIALFFVNSYVDETRRLRYNLVRQNSRLSHEVATDPLTGIANRRSFDEYMAERIETFDQTRSPFAFAIVDIDHFKEVNDTYGHDKGDEVLRKVAQILQQSIRADDFAARYGGEEFVIFFNDCTLEHGALLAERIRERIERSALLGDRPLSVSIGVGAPVAGDTPNTLFSRTDEALYRAKQNGRNRVER